MSVPRTNSASFSRSTAESRLPLGLCGELTMIRRVFGEISFLTCSQSGA